MARQPGFLGAARRSLTLRVTAAVVALVAATCVLVSFLTTSTVTDTLTDRLDSDLAAAHDRSVRALERGLPQPPSGMPPGEGPPPDIREARGQVVGTVTAYLADDGAGGTEGVGQVLGTDDDAALRDVDDEVVDALAALELADEPVDAQLPGLGHYRVVSRVVDDVTVVTAMPTTSVDEAVSDLVGWGVLYGSAATILCGAVAALVVRRQLRPLREVAEAAHRVAATDLSTGAIGVTERVPERLVDATEVGQVASAFNTMLGHVESALDERHRSEQQVRQFVADASHELRTPLATVLGYADLGLRDSGDPAGDAEVRTQALGKVRTEARRMGALVEDLLLLARLDQGRPLVDEEVDLTRLVMESVGDARVTAPEHRWVLDLPAEAVTVRGDDLRLHQVLTNLLSNASRHTPPGTTVTTTLRVVGGAVEVDVLDDGPGIAPELLGEVFDRFTRGDSARTRAASGAGLGLSLARSIARAHGGDLTVTSQPGRTCFTLALPA